VLLIGCSVVDLDPIRSDPELFDWAGSVPDPLHFGTDPDPYL
jgi:hypothetical protein